MKTGLAFTVDYLPVVKENVACLIFYNLKKLEPIFIILANYVLNEAGG